MPEMDLLYVETSDGLKLPGFYYPVNDKETCVLFVHGMSGFILENYFGHVLGQELQKKGYGFLFTHNRGYAHLNDVVTNENKEDGGYTSRRLGATYERFEDCILDIDAWVSFARDLGYKKLVIVGHSLGCSKIIHYLSEKKSDVTGVVLASPGDMVGLVKKPGNQPDYEQLLQEALENVENGQPEKLLSAKIWDWYTLSSQTFLDLFSEGGPADNLPLLRNLSTFTELGSLTAPILCILGELDDVVIRSLEDDLRLLKEKAINALSFDTHVLAGANHGYEGKEREFSDKVIEWLESKNN